MPVSPEMLKQLEEREKRLDAADDARENFAVLEAMLKKYGPEAKVADVIASERNTYREFRVIKAYGHPDNLKKEAYGEVGDETTCAFSGDPCVPGESWSNADEKRRREEEERLG